MYVRDLPGGHIKIDRIVHELEGSALCCIGRKAAVAAFDIDPNKIGKTIAGVKCYSKEELTEIFKNLNISIGVITVPPENASDVAEKLVNAGVKGILNFTTVPLNVSSDVYLEEYDMVTSLEKVAYFVKKQRG